MVRLLQFCGTVSTRSATSTARGTRGERLPALRLCDSNPSKGAIHPAVLAPSLAAHVSCWCLAGLLLKAVSNCVV